MGETAKALANADFSFVQISDSHIGFSKSANPDVSATLQAAIDKVNALPTRPSFVLHTGDITQLSKPEEFDTAAQLLNGLKTGQIFYVPGEHDVLDGTGKLYRERHAANSAGDGWYSVDIKGAHFVGLVNVLNLEAGAGSAHLGQRATGVAQQNDSEECCSSSTPIVVFAHIPLWSVYPDWGWGTDDSAQALSYMKRFGSVTVLNGHIHQTMRKVEGNITFHTALSTAFPQPAPGTPGASPGPVYDSSRSVARPFRNYRCEFYCGPTCARGDRLNACSGGVHDDAPNGEPTMKTACKLLMLAVAVSLALGAPGDGIAKPAPRASDAVSYTINIKDFMFTPRNLVIPVGAKVTWTNKDEEPHKVAEINNAFTSQPLDTDEGFTYEFKTPGEYEYFCTVHPRMTGQDHRRGQVSPVRRSDKSPPLQKGGRH